MAIHNIFHGFIRQLTKPPDLTSQPAATMFAASSLSAAAYTDDRTPTVRRLTLFESRLRASRANAICRSIVSNFCGIELSDWRAALRFFTHSCAAAGVSQKTQYVRSGVIISMRKLSCTSWKFSWNVTCYIMYFAVWPGASRAIPRLRARVHVDNTQMGAGHAIIAVVCKIRVRRQHEETTLPGLDLQDYSFAPSKR